MSEIDQILSQVPMDQLAAQLGVDPATAEQATRSALPALLGGLQANASDPAGASSLASALTQHADSSALGGSLDAVDTGDGNKIVQNIFGGQTQDVVRALGSSSAVPGDSGLVQKLLPILAPIVLAYLGKKLQGSGGLGGMLGGATGNADPQTQAAPGGLGDILGQVLGGAAGGSATGGTAGGASGGMGDLLSGVLGGLLGGGKR